MSPSAAWKCRESKEMLCRTAVCRLCTPIRRSPNLLPALVFKFRLYVQITCRI